MMRETTPAPDAMIPAVSTAAKALLNSSEAAIAGRFPGSRLAYPRVGAELAHLPGFVKPASYGRAARHRPDSRQAALATPAEQAARRDRRRADDRAGLAARLRGEGRPGRGGLRRGRDRSRGRSAWRPGRADGAGPAIRPPSNFPGAEPTRSRGPVRARDQ